MNRFVPIMCHQIKNESNLLLNDQTYCLNSTALFPTTFFLTTTFCMTTSRPNFRTNSSSIFIVYATWYFCGSERGYVIHSSWVTIQKRNPQTWKAMESLLRPKLYLSPNFARLTIFHWSPLFNSHFLTVSGKRRNKVFPAKKR